MTPAQKAIFSFLSVIACALLVFVIALYHGVWQRPLGPSLQLATVTPLQLPATWTPNAGLGGTLTPVEPVPATPETISASINSPTPTPAPVMSGACGGPAVMNILAIGSDARGDHYNYGLADVIRLVRVDFVNPRVTVLEFPRDLWVEIPDIADNLNGQDHERLNQAYLYGNRGFGYTDDPAQGPGLLARTMTLNFGTTIDNYAAVNMRTFEKIVNAVDGINVYLPEPVDGRTADDPSERLLFDAGTHHLDGTRALTLARIRIEGTFARADNQNRVLCALRDKLTSPEVVPGIPALIQSFRGAIQTDLSPAQLGQLACIGTKIQPGNITFASFPHELFKGTRIYDPVFKGRVFIWDVDFDILRGYIAQFNEGTWPPPRGASQDNDQEGIPFCP
jgi:LCP family protein required for cell wall assembly